MACFSGVGADECTVFIALDDVVADFTVEEDNRDTSIFRGIGDALSGVRGGGIDDVDNQKVVAVRDCGVDLVGLLSLVVVAVEVLVGNAE